MTARRAHQTVLGAVLALAAAAASAQWPVDGSFEILHSHGTPIRQGAVVLHAGIDILGYGLVVRAARAGTVVQSSSSLSCGTVRVEVSAAEVDAYLHVHPEVSLGDRVSVGTRLGTIVTNCLNHSGFEHLHWQVESGSAATFLFANPLAVLPATLRDPNQAPVLVRDTSGDSRFVTVVARDASSGSATGAGGITVVWGNIELAIEAADDMSPTGPFDVAPHQIAYWIEALGAGADVASATQPYQATCVGTQSLGSSAVAAVCVERHGCARLAQPAATPSPWPRYLSWLVTRSSCRRPATGGCASCLPPSAPGPTQFWNTLAAACTTCQPNGSDASPAASSTAARFPDGRYRLHVLASDLSHAETEQTHDLLVDNWPPLLRRAAIEDAAESYTLLESVWSPESSGYEALAREAARVAYRDSGREPAGPHRLTVAFSEPMGFAEIVLPNGERVPGSARVDDDSVWEWSLDVDLDSPAAAAIEIWAADLAGNSLVPIEDWGAEPLRRPVTAAPARPQLLQL